ncbi:hypothetical protein Fcan01_18126 [Folsomia candida]|uniref:Ricin B lectin domain-containing protein n=1 Tax=Folsomia candida TaxID=158441 RepID=A0A226DR44_FOLCA|nr:hypothetical protein Fcan01_18126 [Folsomia candida]
MKLVLLLILVTLLVCISSELNNGKDSEERPGPEMSGLEFQPADGKPLNYSSLFDPTRDTNTKYYIFLRSTYWRCLTCDCSSGNNGNNLPVSIAFCYPTTNQLFYLIPTNGTGIYIDPPTVTSDKATRASFTYKIVNANDDRCLDRYHGPGDTDGAVVDWVVTNECVNTDGQKWIFNQITQSNAYQYFTIQNQAVSTNGYITTRSLSTSEGTLVHLWELTDATNPDWTQTWAYTS